MFVFVCFVIFVCCVVACVSDLVDGLRLLVAIVELCVTVVLPYVVVGLSRCVFYTTQYIRMFLFPFVSVFCLWPSLSSVCTLSLSVL